MNYEDLQIYKLSKQLALEVHALSLLLPKFEQFETGSQIRRASKSVRSNIVEGFGRRRYKKEFIRFLTYALASADETMDHLECLLQTGSYTNEENINKLISQYQILGRMLIRFIMSVEKNHR